MRNQFKVVLLVLVVLLSSLSVVVWKTQSLILEDKMSNLADVASKQIAPLRRLVQERLDEGKTQLVRYASARATSTAGKAPALSQFDVISLVRQSANGHWEPIWIEKSSSAKTDRWPSGYETALLGTMSLGKVKDGRAHWFRLSDAKGDPIYAMALTVEEGQAREANSSPGAQTLEGQAQLPDSTDYNAAQVARVGNKNSSDRKAILVGFSSRNALAAVADDFIGSTSLVYIVDDRGFVTSHPNKSWIGANFTEDPIVKDLLRSKKAASTGQYSDMNLRSSVGHFERIDGTNLTAIVMSPLVLMTGLIKAVKTVALLTGLSIGLLGLLAAWYVGRGLSQPSLKLAEAPHPPEVDRDEDEFAHVSVVQVADVAPRSRVEPISSVQTAAQLFESELEISSDRLAAEREAAFTAINQGLSTEINEPLMAILGHAQLAKTKTNEDEVRAHAESIEREARRAKNVLEKLRGFGASDVASNETALLDLREFVQTVLEQMKARFIEESITLQAEFAFVPKVRGSKSQLRQVLDNVLENAIEAMSRRQNKQLNVKLARVDERIVLSIQDSGVGMSRDVQARVFEPFFKNFESLSRVGLGLTFVQTALRQMGGKCGVESVPGEGSTFTFDFPIAIENLKETYCTPDLEISPVAEILANNETDALALQTSALAAEPGETAPLTTVSSFKGSSIPDAFEIDEYDDLEMDEDDEPFANVPLGKALKTSELTQGPRQENSGSAEAIMEIGSGGPAHSESAQPREEFKVSIRRPKTKN